MSWRPPQRFSASQRRALEACAKKGVLILPGLGNSYKDYAELAERLHARDFDVEIAQVARADWLRNAAGLTDPAYYRGTLQPRPTVDWYLNKARNSMQRHLQLKYTCKCWMQWAKTCCVSVLVSQLIC